MHSGIPFKKTTGGMVLGFFFISHSLHLSHQQACWRLFQTPKKVRGNPQKKKRGAPPCEQIPALSFRLASGEVSPHRRHCPQLLISAEPAPRVTSGLVGTLSTCQRLGVLCIGPYNHPQNPPTKRPLALAPNWLSMRLFRMTDKLQAVTSDSNGDSMRCRRSSET